MGQFMAFLTMRPSPALILLTAAMLAGCSTGPVALKLPPPGSARAGSYSPSPALREQIDQLLPDSLFPPSQAAVIIVSLRTGETLYDLNSALALNPASNQKLITSAAALTQLGPQYQFATELFFDTTGTPSIFLRGGADPLLRTAELDSLAALVAPRLPAGRQWTIVGDVSLFDDLEKGPGWAWDDDPDPTAMPISALSLNGNTITIRARPAAREGDTVTVESDPRTSYVTWNNEARTADSTASTLRITRNWKEGTNQVLLSGMLSRRDSLRQETINIQGGNWYTLTVFKERLEARGIVCGGMAIDTVPSVLQVAARLTHRLDSVIVFMNRTSDNLAAECLLRCLAVARRGKPGSASAGGDIVREYLSTAGIDTTRMIVADGSGVSRYNLVSARALVRLLAAMDARKDLRDLWRASLPLAGYYGTLSGRMKGTPAVGNLAAKTGTLEGVSSLSGYVTTADGEPLAFSIMMEHFPASARFYRQVQDRIGCFLAGMNLRSYSR
jgi:D-alanyl-D-alanine carboxypeptidase/D-alanyl-D-alanine-endopeptidase (penicillin-binding protein 4)